MGTLLIISHLLRMLAAIQLNNQLRLPTRKIGKERPNRKLSPKLKPRQAAIAQLQPQG
jgi:hypothetical protein